MTKNKTIVQTGAVFALALGIGLSGGAMAAQVNDTTLSGAFFNGAGNPNNNFTVATEGLGNGSIELGLRARIRGGANVTPNGDTYSFDTGVDAKGRALWNYDFSIDLGTSGYHLSDFTAGGKFKASLTIASAGGLGIATIDPVIYWSDSATYDGSTVFQNGTGLGSNGEMIAEQNSQNLKFVNGPLAGFDPQSSDTYTFTLAVSSTGTSPTVLDSVTMHVDVPEPASMMLFGVGLAGLGMVSRRRKA